MEKRVNFAQLDIISLKKELDKKSEELFSLRKEQVLGKLENYYKIVRAKKEVARVKTFISLKEVLASESGTALEHNDKVQSPKDH